jgi:hypothetical protein
MRQRTYALSWSIRDDRIATESDFPAPSVGFANHSPGIYPRALSERGRVHRSPRYSPEDTRTPVRSSLAVRVICGRTKLLPDEVLHLHYPRAYASRTAFIGHHHRPGATRTDDERPQADRPTCHTANPTVRGRSTQKGRTISLTRCIMHRTVRWSRRESLHV